MTEFSEHPYVTEYLRRFDQAAAALPHQRRMLLREEIADHLRDMIPASASDKEATDAIAQFGSPAEILAQDVDASGPGVVGVSRRRRRWVGWAIAVVLVALTVLALLPVVSLLRGPQDPPASPTLPGNPLVEEPDGTERVTSGQAYFEYLAAIESMEHPLPDGAEYPIGVPDGLDAGQTGDGTGVLESGAGGTIAHFSWLCAWESEYLAAVTAGDDRRLVAAESMITSWSTSGFYLAMDDTERAWVGNVVAPMRIGDSTGVRQDRTQTCAQAGIVDAGST
jgi:hypothetical protein